MQLAHVVVRKLLLCELGFGSYKVLQNAWKQRS